MKFVLISARQLLLAAALLLLVVAPDANAASPNCGTEGGTLLSWPSVDPIWELCWVPPNSSVGPRGSGLELRAVHYRGILVAKRIHAPMLFAEYAGGSGGNCYRDWKDTGTATLAHTSTHNQMAVPPDLSRLATTSCSVSQHPTTSYGTCPFQQATGGGYACTAATGVVIEDLGDEVRLTTQYRADWYMYDSRISFGADGSIEPIFGFGNNNGTFNTVTHWHHNYWRFDFYIDDQASHVVAANGVDQATEFSDLRGAPGSRTWSVRNPASGRGYQLIPQANDYVVATNESTRGFHTVDFMATRYVASEYGDNPNYSLSDCDMNQAALVNGASIDEQDVVLWYRVAVRDTTSNSWPPGCGGAGNPCIAQDSMICKSAGPRLVPFGDWGQGLPEQADLSVIAASVPAITAPGGTVQIDVTVSNAGPQDSTDLTVTLDLPADLGQAALLDGASEWSCVASGAAEITCTFGGTSVPAAGESAFSVALDVDASAPAGERQTVVTVASPEWLDPDSGNNVATATTTITAGSADLSISGSTQPEPVVAGGVVQLGVIVASVGPQPTGDVVVSVALPDELRLAAQQAGNLGWNCNDADPALVVCSLGGGVLGTENTVGFSLDLAVDSQAAPGSVETALSVSSAQWPDPDLGNNAVTVVTTITAGGADLSLAGVAVPNPVEPGAVLQLQITVSNAGPLSTDNAVVSLDLPPPLTLSGQLPTPSGWNCIEAGSSSMLSCTLTAGEIAAQSQLDFLLNLNVDPNAADGEVAVNANVSSSQWPDPDDSNNATTVTASILSVTEPGPIFHDGFESMAKRHAMSSHPVHDSPEIAESQ